MAKQYSSPPEMVIDPTKRYQAILKTEHGDIRVDLFADRAPKTVNNFVFLAREGYYDDTTFHRVIKDFMVQGGDPTGTGRGGPGYQFDDELDAAREHGYPRGTIAMANAGPGTNGSQFFVCLDDVGLPPSYSVFGTVVDGMEALDAIAAVPLAGESPTEPVTLQRVTVDL